MVSFPNAKINLGLYITARREDGYHDIETLFYPIHTVRDALEIVPAQETGIAFTSWGLPIQGDANNNLCIKAYHVFKQRYPQLPGIQAHLLKAIPMGAGLGGGSADGAFMLQLLNQCITPGATREELAAMALELGSDCPFFLENKACYASGRGEILTPVALDLNAYRIILVNPGIHVPTGWAFSQITPAPPAHPLLQILEQPVVAWKDILFNVFEAPIMLAHPDIREVKEQLYAQGALYASMTGTGSTVFGIFPKDASPSFTFPSHYHILH